MMNQQNAFYYVFEDLLHKDTISINVGEVNSGNWQEYYNGLTNLIMDYIEDERVQSLFITLDFGKDGEVELSLFDTYMNIIMWYPLVRLNVPITGKNLFFDTNITADSVKDYFDDNIIEPYKGCVDSIFLNNILDDTVHFLIDTDRYSMYLSNTLNLRDTIDLMDHSKEFDDIMHTSFANLPLEEVKDIGLQMTDRAIELIKDSENIMGYDHCLANSFRAREGIKIRQYKEFIINIGSKPNGVGGVYPTIIDGSYLNAALSGILPQFIDSAAARIAQIQTKKNTGDSGKFARVLGLNNTDTDIIVDDDYDCHTNNLIELHIADKKTLSKLYDRWYRTIPDGIERLITRESEHLIGQTIYLRSPMTCASAARGNGICPKCYGRLYMTNANIKPGKYAAEKLSSELTQRELSSKHLTETDIKKLEWFPGFDLFFIVNLNAIQIGSSIPDGTQMIIDINSVDRLNEEDYDSDEEISTFEEYNEFITSALIRLPDGTEYTIGTVDDDRLFWSKELKQYLQSDKCIRDEYDNYIIDLSSLYMMDDEFNLFYIDISNNELSKTLKDITNLIDLKQAVTSHTKDSIIQEMLRLIIVGGIHIMSVHLEVLIMNQMRDDEDILSMPDWSVPNAGYQILSLSQSLSNNPSVAVTLMYQNLGKVLYDPMTFKKFRPSRMDVFFMKQPQLYLRDEDDNVIEDKPKNNGRITIAKKYRVKDEGRI